MPPGGKKHGFVVARITYLLSNYVYKNKLGIITGANTGYEISLNPQVVTSADMAFESNERLSYSGFIDGYSTIMPDLVVEVNSPFDSHKSVIKKVDLWLEAGVRAVWVIDPADKAVAIYNSQGLSAVFEAGDEFKVRDVLPGFKCNVEDIFGC